MIVCIDVSQVIYDTGSSTYTRNLVKNLLKIDPKVEYKLFGGSLRRKGDLNQFYGSLVGNFKATAYPIPPTVADILWNKLHVINIENFEGKIDIFHSSDWTQPPTKAKKVTTIHDMSPILFPKFTHPKIIQVHKKRLSWVKKEVDIILVPSKATKNDVINYGIDSDKVKIIPEAVESIFYSVEGKQIALVKNKFSIGNNYLLAVGVNPRKNIQSIIKAFEKISNDTPLELVVVGKAIDFNIHGNSKVIFTGHVTNSELAALYGGAEALVYASFYEGFGLPVLEAFASSCPVVCSNISSLPEVAGNAAVLVDPYSVDSIELGIRKILKNSQEYIAKGKQRVKNFSWESSAIQTLEIYNKLYNTIK